MHGSSSSAIVCRPVGVCTLTPCNLQGWVGGMQMPAVHVAWVAATLLGSAEALLALQVVRSFALLLGLGWAAWATVPFIGSSVPQT